MMNFIATNYTIFCFTCTQLKHKAFKVTPLPTQILKQTAFFWLQKQIKSAFDLIGDSILVSTTEKSACLFVPCLFDLQEHKKRG